MLSPGWREGGPSRSDVVSSSKAYRLRNFVTSQYLAVSLNSRLESHKEEEEDLAVQPTLKREGGGRIKRQIEVYSKIDRSSRPEKRGGERVK